MIENEIIEETIYIEIETKPIAKGRPRFSRAKNFVRTYTPKKTSDFENEVYYSFMEKFGSKYKNDPRPIIMEVKMFSKISSVRKGEILPNTKRPDLDNLEKAIYDGLSEIAYLDDSQIYKHTTSKWRATFDKIEITINYMKEK